MTTRRQRPGSPAPKGQARPARTTAAASGRGTGRPANGEGRAPRGTKPGRSSAASGRGASRSGPRSVADRSAARGGAARTGAVRAEGAPRPKTAKSLGGEQVEGRQAVRELLIAGRRKVYEVWVASDLEDNEIVTDIVALADSQRVKVFEVARKRLEAEARSEAPQGVLARAAALPEAELDTLLSRRGGRQPFLVALDGVTDPGNLGALLRSAEGAGVGGVVLPRHRAVHVTPTAAKAAAGAIEHVPIAVVGGLPAALATIRKAGVWVVGLDDGAERSLFEIGDLAREGICLVLGAEGSGLSRLVRERCDMIVSIPMRGRLGSLNVSAAAVLACYEVTRARLTSPS